MHVTEACQSLTGLVVEVCFPAFSVAHIVMMCLMTRAVVIDSIFGVMKLGVRCLPCSWCQSRLVYISCLISATALQGRVEECSKQVSSKQCVTLSTLQMEMLRLQEVKGLGQDTGLLLISCGIRI